MNADDPREVARLLLLLADVLESRTAGVASYGLLRRAARMLATLTVPPAGACPVCGGPVKQPANGRRRTYCGTACRRRAAKPRQNAGLVS